ncbi:MAG TPA: phosphonate ABC transporter, permease protein PhnE [Bdellovibrionales bacterium]|nr:phosphonate ABC transporter, permease protein PhnE [Bdellovibrionales bacterium]
MNAQPDPKPRAVSAVSNAISIKSLMLDAVIFAGLLLGIVFVIMQPTEADLLNLGRNAAMAAAFFVIGLVASYALNKSGVKTLGEAVFEPPHKKAQARAYAWYKTFWGLELIVGFVATFYAATLVTDFSLHELLSEDGFAGAQRIFSALVHPNFEILPQAVLAIVETIFIAFMATVMAIPIAFVLSFVSAKNIMGGTAPGFFIYGLLRTSLNVTRSIEPLIWAIIFSVWVGIGPFAGMLALMIHSIASLTKQYSEMVESVDEGPIEGIQSTGAGPLQVIWFAVVPQIVLPYVSITIYRWDINVRMATVIGLVGGGGIGTMLIQYQGQAMWNEVGTLVLVIAVVVWLMDTSSAYIREAIK